MSKTYEDWLGNKVNISEGIFDSGKGSDGKTYYKKGDHYEDWVGNKYNKSLFDTPSLDTKDTRSTSSSEPLFTSEELAAVGNAINRFGKGVKKAYLFLLFWPILTPYYASKFVLDKIHPDKKDVWHGNKLSAAFFATLPIIFGINIAAENKKNSANDSASGKGINFKVEALYQINTENLNLYSQPTTSSRKLGSFNGCVWTSAPVSASAKFLEVSMVTESGKRHAGFMQRDHLTLIADPTTIMSCATAPPP